MNESDVQPRRVFIIRHPQRVQLTAALAAMTILQPEMFSRVSEERKSPMISSLPPVWSMDNFWREEGLRRGRLKLSLREYSLLREQSQREPNPAKAVYRTNRAPGFWKSNGFRKR